MAIRDFSNWPDDQVPEWVRARRVRSRDARAARQRETRLQEQEATARAKLKAAKYAIALGACEALRTRPQMGKGPRYVDEQIWRIKNEGESHDVPHYTTSLDAAMKMLPPGWTLRLEYFNTMVWMAQVTRSSDGAPYRADATKNAALTTIMAILGATVSHTAGEGK